MKRLITLFFVMCLALTMTGIASAKDKDKGISGIVTDPMCAKSGDKAKMGDADCVKKCAKDGKLSFVADSDGKVWAIDNSDAVKGHEGHHVSVKGKPDAKAGTIHIASVEMMK